jgi:Fanconi anemia group J protein
MSSTLGGCGGNNCCPSSSSCAGTRGHITYGDARFSGMSNNPVQVSNYLCIDGVSIYYPQDRKPFKPQVELSTSIIRALSQKQNALLESPTGTGKTLALLTTALSWQKYRRDLFNKKKNMIFYCSRTHSQLKQVVDEVRRLNPAITEDVTMTVLGSRKKLCQNNDVLQSKMPIEIECRELQKRSKCGFKSKMREVKQLLQTSRVWDIEDALEASASCSGCAYYGIRLTLDERPNIVLAPYNYVIDPNIRRSMKINLDGAVVIFDEGHNLEDVCRSAASCELTNREMYAAIGQLRRLVARRKSGDDYKSLLYLVSEVSRWLETEGQQMKGSPNQSQDERQCFHQHSDIRNSWNGNELLDRFEAQFGLREDTLDVFVQQYLKVTKEEYEDLYVMPEEDTALKDKVNPNDANSSELDEESDDANNPKLGLETVIVLKKLFTCFGFMLSHERNNASSYHVILKVSEDDKRRDIFTVNFHCLTASVAFREVVSGARSVIVTSGTLSPLDSFAGSLHID